MSLERSGVNIRSEADIRATGMMRGRFPANAGGQELHDVQVEAALTQVLGVACPVFAP